MLVRCGQTHYEQAWFSGKIAEAYEMIDAGYEQVRGSKLKITNDNIVQNKSFEATTWEDYKTYVPRAWKTTVLHKKTRQENPLRLEIQKDALGSYVLYSVKPGEGILILEEQNEIKGYANS